MVQVKSEAIREIAYDSGTQMLRIGFTDGDWYSYFAVPQRIYRAFLHAESHGRYFHDHIRDRFRYRKGR